MKFAVKLAGLSLAAATAVCSAAETAETAEKNYRIPAAAEAEADAYQMRRSGDAALVLGQLAVADRDYRNYTAACLARGDSEGFRDSVIRRVNLYLQMNDSAAADAVIAEFKTYVDEPDGRFVSDTLNAEVALLKGDYPQAEEQLRNLLAQADLPEYLRNPAGYALGEALIAQKKYRDAAAVYTALAADNGGFDAEYQAIFALQEAEELIESQAGIEALSVKELSDKEKNRIELLKINQAVREKRFSEAKALFAALPPSDMPDGAKFELSSVLARHFAENKQLADAVVFFQMAYDTAPSLAERKFALTNLIDSETQAGNFNRAADLMQKYLERYANGGDKLLNQLELAHLMTRQNNLSGAAACYLAIQENAESGLELRLTAAYEAAAVYHALGKQELTGKMLDFMIANATQVETQAEARLLLARLRFEMRNYAAAGQLAAAAAELNTKWKFDAMFLMLQAQEEQGDYSAALATARRLKNQGIDQWPQKGAFAEARLLEKAGDVPGAINAYANFGALWNFSDQAPEALYAAGKLAFEHGDYGRSGEVFRLLASRYPHYELTAHGLYMAVYGEYLQGRSREMNSMIAEMKKNYPNSNYTVAALLWQLDLLKLAGNNAAAEKLLEEMLQTYKDFPADIIEDIRLEYAILLQSSDREKAAVAELQKIAESKAGNKLRSKSNFLLGDIQMRFGEYQAAEKSFMAAQELAPDREFKVAAQGRVADSYYAAGSLAQDKELLKSAAQEYQAVLAAADKYSMLYYQAGFKLGKVAELNGSPEEALGYYRQMVMDAAAAPAILTAGEAAWIEKSVAGAVNVLLARQSAVSAEEAAGIIALAEQLNLPDEVNFESLKVLIHSKYQL